MEKAKKPLIKKVREFLRKKEFRDAEGLLVAEGTKIVTDALKKNRGVVSVFVSGKVVGAPFVKEINALCVSGGIDIWRVPAGEFEKLSSLKSSQGVLALARKPFWPTSDNTTFSVLCDGVQDPGNLGAMIRTSAAFGVSSVLLFGATVDVYNPKVVRASSGAVFDIPVRTVTLEQLDALKSAGRYFLSSDPGISGAESMYDVCLPEGPVILAFGNEGRGMSPEIRKRADRVFYIPIEPDTESLNVTAAAAVAIHHFKKR